jgi:hypothetical protein
MRFITMVWSKEESVGALPPAFLEAMGKLAKDAAEDGCVMIGTGGLYPTAAGARVALSGGKVTVTDGPFSEAKEVIGGYAMFETNSKATIIKWTERFMELHKWHLPGWEGETEIRQLYEEGEKPCEAAA